MRVTAYWWRSVSPGPRSRLIPSHSLVRCPTRRIFGVCCDSNDPSQVSTRHILYIKSLCLSATAGAITIVALGNAIWKAFSAKPSPRQVRRIHIDQSPRGAIGRARRHLDKDTVQSIESRGRRLLVISVWKSICGNVTDHLLTFADCRTLQQSDLIPVRQIYLDYVGGTYAVKSGRQQKF